MRLHASSYRDEHNDIVDDIVIDDSVFERIVVFRNGGSVTVRGRTSVDDDVFEIDFERVERRYSGLRYSGGIETTVHDDVAKSLFAVGYCVVPNDVQVHTPENSDTVNEDSDRRRLEGDDE